MWRKMPPGIGNSLHVFMPGGKNSESGRRLFWGLAGCACCVPWGFHLPFGTVMKVTRLFKCWSASEKKSPMDKALMKPPKQSEKEQFLRHTLLFLPVMTLFHLLWSKSIFWITGRIWVLISLSSGLWDATRKAGGSPST